MLLFSLILLIACGVFLQSSQSSNASVKKEELNSQADSLLFWMSSLKDQSRQLRDEGKVISAINRLSEVINTRWREPNTNEEYEKLAWIYTNRAYLHHESLGDFLAAKEDYLSALKQFESCDPSDYLVARYVYQPLGNIYTRLGENEIAISMLERFKRVCEETGETEALMNAYNDIGRAHMNTGKYTEAIRWFEEGVEIDPSDNFNIGLLYSSKCQAEKDMKDFNASRNSAEKSLSFLDRVMSQTDSSDYHFIAARKYKIAVLQVLGACDNHFGNSENAHAYYGESLSLAEKLFSDQHRARIRALVELGKSYRALGKNFEAVQCYQLSLSSMFEKVSAASFGIDIDKSELFADVVLGEVLSEKAIVAHEIFRETGEQSWLNVSVKSHLTYFDWLDVQRSEQFEFNSKLSTANEAHRKGEIALSAFYEMYAQTNDKKWIDSAFVVMDQTKAIVLAEERGFKELANKNPKIRSLLKEQNALKFQRSIFTSAIQKAEEEGSMADVVRVKKRLSELDEQSQLLEQSIRRLFPAYRMQTDSKIGGDVRKRLKEKLTSRDAQLLSYFVGEDEVYSIIGTPANFHFSKVSKRLFDEKTTHFLKELSNPVDSKPEKFAQSGKQLFDLLIGDKVVSLGANWVILPDGVLNSLPFEALVTKTASNASYRKLSYLLNDHVIHYAPSAYFFVQDRVGEKAEKSFLGMAPVFMDSKEYDFLPKSREELEAGVSLFSGVDFTEEKATKNRFFKEAELYDILHISTHAGRNSGNNNDAWMVFSDVHSRDHRMTANELLQLDLTASLVVLNACETGNGTVFNGEGPMSLARGFLDAGSQSTVTNLWSVSHESNAAIMKSFYENMKENQSPSMSLSKAKLAYLASSEIDDASAHPYYWSSAILIGTDISVTGPDSYIFMWIWGVGAMLAVTLGATIYRRRKREMA